MRIKNKNCSASYERSHLYNHFYYSWHCTYLSAGLHVWPSRHNKTDTGQPRYKAGVYTSSIQFEGQNLDVQVVVDENHINSVSFVNLNDTVTTMYPLMQSSMDNISEQICKTQSVDNISYSEENQYTASMLLHAVEDALQKAAADTDE